MFNIWYKNAVQSCSQSLYPFLCCPLFYCLLYMLIKLCVQLYMVCFIKSWCILRTLFNLSIHSSHLVLGTSIMYATFIYQHPIGLLIVWFTGQSWRCACYHICRLVMYCNIMQYFFCITLWPYEVIRQTV